MDDVGQTLLNWASAFGTQEMVRKCAVIAAGRRVSCTSELTLAFTTPTALTQFGPHAIASVMCVLTRADKLVWLDYGKSFETQPLRRLHY